MIAGARRHAVRRHRQRRQGLPRSIAQGKGSLFFDSAELEVHALAPAPERRPLRRHVARRQDLQGRSQRHRRRRSSSRDDKYIWALAVDAKGNLFAGTGDKGIIYKITPDGKGAPFYKTNATHATALAFDKAGNLLVGTGTPGQGAADRRRRQGVRAARLAVPGNPRAALRRQGHALRRRDQRPRRRPGGAGRRTDTAARSARRRDRARAGAVGVGRDHVDVDRRRRRRRHVDRLAARGSPRAEGRRLPHRARRPLGSAVGVARRLAVRPDVRRRRRADHRHRQQGQDVSARRRSAAADAARARQRRSRSRRSTRTPRGRLYYATANPGKLFRLSSDRAHARHLRIGARATRRWSRPGARSAGTARTPGGSQIELFTRSGNTETPDDTWSAWSARLHQRRRLADHQPEGALPAVARGADRQRRRPGAHVGHRRLPAAQSAAAGAHRSPCIRRASCSRSRSRPAIPSSPASTIRSTPDRKLAAAGERAAGNASPSLGRRTYQKGLQTLVWKADDENDDDLVYDVLYRREGETAWKTLRKAISDTILVWDTTTVPNGTYFVKIVASDAPSNPLGTALTGELDSVGVRDRQHAAGHHGRPASASIAAAPIVTFDVKDDHSPIQRVEFSQDGQRWRGVFPVDGIADSRERALRAGDRRRAGRARADAPGQRLDEQRRDGPRRRARDAGDRTPQSQRRR